MDVTARRFLGISLGAFVLIALARPPRPTGLRYDELAGRTRVARTQAELQAVEDSLAWVGSAIRARVVRDSAARLLGALPAGGRDEIIVDPRLPASLQRHLRGVYAESRRRMPATTLALPILVVLDSSGALHSESAVEWLEASQLGLAACATIVRVRVSGRDLLDAQRLARRAHGMLGAGFPRRGDFGLCGFEAVFGEPSPATRTWLAARSWKPVQSGYVGTPTAAPAADLQDAMWWWASENGRLALDFRACVVGRTEYCLAAAAPTDQLRRRTRFAGELPGLDGTWGWWGWRGSPWLMNELAAAMGPKGFAALWQGSDSVPAAYRRITGVPIDSLAHRLLAGPGVMVDAGATLSPAELIAALVLAALFAGLSALSHPRRSKP